MLCTWKKPSTSQEEFVPVPRLDTILTRLPRSLFNPIHKDDMAAMQSGISSSGNAAYQASYEIYHRATVGHLNASGKSYLADTGLRLDILTGHSIFTRPIPMDLRLWVLLRPQSTGRLGQHSPLPP